MQALDPDSVAHAAELIAQSDALIVAAGAGMGVDSGLPDFRGKEGFWQAYPALGREQVDFHRLHGLTERQHAEKLDYLHQQGINTTTPAGKD